MTSTPSMTTLPPLRASVPPCLPASRPPLPTAYRLLPTPRSGFTLTEVLVVVAVLVLLLAVSVPLFKSLTGNRSVDAASNVLAAALGDARAEAIALQRAAGLFFYTDRATGRTYASLVRTPGETFDNSVSTQRFYPLDFIPDREPYALPPNVGLQVLDNCVVSNGARQDDGYIGMNGYPQAVPTDPFRYGGVILFDGRGHLISVYYGFQLKTNATGDLTEMGKLFTDESNEQNSSGAPFYFVPPNSSPSRPPPLSQFGFVLHDAELFRAVPGHNAGDADFTGNAYSPTELGKETWLDANGLPFLVNRYTGALTRGE